MVRAPSTRSDRPARPPSHQRAFSLIEVMIAVVVVGILTAIALPQYNAYVQRSRIVDATQALNDYRVRMEQFFQDRRQYNDVANCGAPLPPMPPGATWNFTCAPAGNPALSYVATATGVGPMAGFVYRVTVDPTLGGVGTLRETVAVPVSWTPLPAPNTCWQVRKGGHCS
jgi:type IV pilus assembly protein PilE